MYMILLCLFIATILPILSKAPLAFAQAKAGGYDNRNPRAQQAALTGFGARAKAGHENAFEALLMFIPGALAVLVTGQVDTYAQYLAQGFIVARVLYHFFYLFDWHLPRSLVWTAGFACSVLLLLHAVQGASANL
ncbi:MAPEG family protein [Bowmanella denitrificans]|uniref:MAPEG family protein n=1 Tax=Bowmanella denitrificans TaxID=366582 RepID=A0ABP3GE39_9ALTE|nr:MAPEG family protein [Bowmanella denitrificans]